MINYWPWGLAISIPVMVTIWMNGHHWRDGWLIGMGAQLAQIGFGMVTGIWTFYFAAGPLVMFAWNWWQHPKREAARNQEIAALRAELAEARRREAVQVDVANGDQVIVMSRGVLDRIRESAAQAPDPIPGVPLGLRHAMGGPWLSSPIPPVNLSPFGAFTTQVRSAGDELAAAYAELADRIRQAGLLVPESTAAVAGEVDVRPAVEQLDVEPATEITPPHGEGEVCG